MKNSKPAGLIHLIIIALPFLAGITSSVFAQNQKPLPESLLPGLSKIGHMISDGKSMDEIQNAWKTLLTNSKDIHVDGAINYIIADAKSASKQKVDLAIKRVQFDSLLKKQVAGELTIAKRALSDLIKTKATKPLNRKRIGLKPDRSGNIQIRQNGIASTKPEIEAYIKQLEDQMSEVGDDAYLANIDLQNALQKQQQILQMMANISKLLDDTAMAVIRKIGR